jgi:hypothetical protein
MDLRPALQIQTAIRAITDVVLPAVDPGNRLAQEQAQLVIGMLHIVLQRLPQMYSYDKDELVRSIKLASDLQGAAVGLAGTTEILTALSNAAQAGTDVLARAGADPSELEAANIAMREAVGGTISALYGAADSGMLKPVSALVTSHSHEQLLRERSWLIGQGWEADPASLPLVETLLNP